MRNQVATNPPSKGCHQTCSRQHDTENRVCQIQGHMVNLIEKIRPPSAKGSDREDLRCVTPSQQIVATIKQEAEDFSKRGLGMFDDLARYSVRFAAKRFAEHQQAQSEE